MQHRLAITKEPGKGLIEHKASAELWNSPAIGQWEIAPPVNQESRLEYSLPVAGLASKVPYLGNTIVAVVGKRVNWGGSPRTRNQILASYKPRFEPGRCRRMMNMIMVDL